MSSERSQKVDAILESALQRDTSQRHAFLDEACAGDQSLRSEVDSLIAAHEQRGASNDAVASSGAGDRGESMAGRTLGHYSIISMLGAGGMGEVHLARDSKLGRKVALKLLPAGATEDEERVRRFQQEARAASALNHPNIITVYEIGEAESQHFIAAEFIDGETMRATIDNGEVAVNKLLELLAQVAEGLAKAHGSGIVHRDLKPDNIMVTRDGYAKVLDFGLAKLVETKNLMGLDPKEAETALLGRTQDGVVMGTAGYMSPEQAQGKPADHRSDVFSFGCILYQAVTRHKPFEGDSFIDVLHKVVYAEPPPVTHFSPRCPAELQRIIRKCLAKDPERRYHCMKDAAIDLRALVEEFEREPSTLDKRSALTASGVWYEAPALQAPVFESTLSDDDPAVRQTTRFSNSSIALALLAAVSVILIWPAYRRASIDSEFKLDFPKVVAISKAREVVTGFGYDAARLEESASFEQTEFDLKRVVAAEGIAGARRAVGEGKAAVWKILLSPRAVDPTGRAALLLGRLKPGDFSVWIDARGRLMNFTTPRREEGDIAGLEREQAISIAEAAVRRMLSVDPSGYDVEFIKKTNPPGVSEMTWRNPNLISGHREVVRADLQGSQVTKLSRSLEPLQDPDLLERDRSEGMSTVESIRGGIVILAFAAVAVLGVVFLIRGKRWNALRQRLPIAASLLVMVGLGVLFWATGTFGPAGWFLAFLIVVIFAAVVTVASFVPFAGVFEWLRTINPARLFGAEQLLKGRVFSRPVAASLVFGLLGGALAAGLIGTGSVLKSMTPGYSPGTSVTSLVTFGSPAALASAGVLGALIYMLLVAVVVELSQRLIRKRALATLIPALLIVFGSSSLTIAGVRLLAVDLLVTFLVAVVTVHTYRSRGFAAAFLLVVVYELLDLATRAYYVGESSFVLQSNLILGLLALMLVVGVWAYVREPLKKKFAAFGLG